jgi:hypothetical protein
MSSKSVVALVSQIHREGFGGEDFFAGGGRCGPVLERGGAFLLDCGGVCCSPSTGHGRLLTITFSWQMCAVVADLTPLRS